MIAYYLFSETSNPFHEQSRANIKKLPHANKRYCLKNFIRCFPNTTIMVLVDGIVDGTWEWLESVEAEHPNVILKKIHAGSMAKAFRTALEFIKELPENQVVGIVEDDWLFLPNRNVEQSIQDAIVYGDYICPQTHPDKWMLPSEGGNAFVEQQNVSEITRIIKCPTNYWHITNSCTCTFFTTRDTISEDWEEWMWGTADLINTLDFATFIRLRQEKERIVLQPIPTLATHCMVGLLAPLIGTGISSWEEV